MKYRRAALVAAAGAAIAIGALTPSRVGAQAAYVAASVCPDDNHAKFHACAVAAARTYKPPLTADGRPDFSGYWRRRVAAFEDFEAHPRTPDDGGGPDVVVDPADGKVPMQPWADAQRKETAAKYMHHNAACFLAGGVGTMYMANLYQFIQTADHFVVVGEGLSAHPYRIVPLDGRPHIGQDIRLWQGDPRGRWEGNTLVIETTNQNGRPFVDQRGRFFTEDVRTIERVTLIDENTLHYTATFEDPNVYTRPFTIAFAYRRNAVEGAEVWEEACYEANEEQMQLFRNNGFRVFPGISAAQAGNLRKAWEARQK